MIDTLTAAAIEAGRAILDVYERDIEVSEKADCSPVTEADRCAEEIILAILAKTFPDIPVIAEEAVSAGEIPEIEGQLFFLVDPLDGTKEFINRRSDFTVNIALISNGEPVAGVVFAPARQVGYVAEGGRATKFHVATDFAVTQVTEICCRPRPASLTAVASRSHSDAETADFLQKNAIRDCTSIGSSLKFCLLAEGLADVYPRFGRTMEWDTAAGDAVLRAAGGRVTTLDGHPFRYGKRRQANDCDFANPGFIGWGRDCGPVAVDKETD
ncbi:3'(2'),5'-bisphosphate nucleotidase CysQ [Ensifer sp.]|uniref:3'(2'),5'-bisphosphate nucleotidase CysQ n=1 Tax=Ensifer sp. TaxID=1872086 RepID=UPI002E14B31D|nr:3'(2'),5'-bisphosphate nucleotidase CysQ [Ensifer sp.]